MKIFRKIIIALWTVIALVEMILGHTDEAILAMCWVIFLQLMVIENK